MKRTYLSALLAFVILTNLVTAFFLIEYKEKYDEKLKENIQDIYFLNGESNVWRLEEGLLILGDLKQYFNAESVEYIGTNKLDIFSYQVNVYIVDDNNNLKAEVFSVLHDASAIKDNLMNNKRIILGSALQEFSTPTQYNFNLDLHDKIYLNIKYSTNKGTFTDTIELSSKKMELSNFNGNN